MNMKKKVYSLLMLIAALFALVATFTISTVNAEENGVIYVHFYNGEGVYHYDEWGGKKDISWGAYYWVDSGKVVKEMGNDEDFSRDDNVGKVFKINLNASETKALSQGKKLGLIMVRSYTDELGYYTPYWNNNTGKDLSSDRYIDVKFNSNNEFNLWIIAGDKNNYLSLDSAKLAFERIESVNFVDFDTIIFQATKAITASTNISIYKVSDGKNNPEGELLLENLHITEEPWNDGKSGKISGLNLTSFDWNTDYELLIDEVSPFRTVINKSRLYLSTKFDSECVPANDTEFGAIYTPSKTTFRVWAPISTNVVVNFYRNGNELDPTLYMPAEAMTKKAKGVRELEVNKNLSGVYYTYTNYVQGEANETVDIYAKAVGVNGNRAMVCDLDSTNTSTWTSDLTKATEIRNNNSKDAVIWEAHVRDFSISPDSGMTYKGKYLAFTEEDTKVKGTNLKSGISYLKDLGINYIHLNPVYDFATVDEEYINNTDYTTKQNWGYDPKNYNVPEGSYATNATDGSVRINEFKQMVEALHKAGIGVIMDVVYNHTYTADSYFEKMVPGYYYRQALSSNVGSFGQLDWTLNALGSYNLSDGSGCSNETASERKMYRDYMVDSLVYWATEYHIDGFRFDLMAIHDVTTMNTIRAALDELPGGEGIMLYGEPWAAGALGLDEEHTGEKSASSANLNLLNSRIAAFNDRIREGIKGNNDGGKGYVQGEFGGINKVKAGINGLFLNYSGDGVVSDLPSHTITYTTSHDNYTLWDQLVNTTVSEKSPTIYSERNAILEYKNMMAAAFVLASKGTSFILAGEEIARTKYGNHNSYNAQDKINAIDYSRQEEFEKLYNWYKGLIEIRTERFTTIAKGANQAWVGDHDKCIFFGYNKEISTDEYSKLAILTNPTDTAVTLDWEGSWILIGDESGINFDSTKEVGNGSITISPYATYIIVQK